MKKSTQPPKVEFEPERLPAFFKAIDIDEPFRQAAISSQLWQIASTLGQKLNLPRMGAKENKRLQQYLRASYKKRQLRQELGPTLQHQIVTAAFLRANPGADIADLSAAIEENQLTLSCLEEEETEHELDIKFLIGLIGDYHKKQVTKYGIEPVFKLLKESGVTPSRKLPLNRMAHALFDLFGIAPRDRVTDATVTSAWRKLDGATR
jgi:hypothetical protein